MQRESLFTWIWRGVISLVGETTLCATLVTASSALGRRRTSMTHHKWRPLWETLGPAYFSQTDLQRPSRDVPSDPWSTAAEQTSHWEVSSSNRRPVAGNIVGALYHTQSSAPEDEQNNCPKHVELTGIINKPLFLHLVGCLYYLYFIIFFWDLLKSLNLFLYRMSCIL